MRSRGLGWWSGLVCCWLVAGCDDGGAASGGDGAGGAAADAGALDAASPVPDAALADAALPDAAPPPPDAAPPPPPLPEVWGPAAAEDVNPDPHVVEVNLTAAVLQTTIAGVDLEMYAYDGQIPGPLIQARVGDTIVVNFTNDLPEPTTIHWHGLRVPDEMDGTPRVQAPVQPGETFTYRFEARDAGSYWYHPHVRSNEQVEKGLYGPIVIRGEQEPAYDRERYLVLDDILLDEDGLAPFMAFHPELMHGRYGNVLLTNGSADEVVGEAAQGQVERWRIVNAANARTMVLDVDGARFRVIGTDGGPLAEPYEADRLVVPVGQRYDLEVSYDRPGPVALRSHILVRGERGPEERPFPVFAVDVAETGEAPPAIEWPALPGLPNRPVSETVTIRFEAVSDPRNGLQWMLNGEAFREEPLFTFRQGSVVRMRLINNAGPEHPFHLHGQFFEVESDGRPGDDEPGLKDTVLVPGRSAVTIKAYLDNPGRWMAHCHILEHAELGMMSEIVVEPAD